MGMGEDNWVIQIVTVLVAVMLLALFTPVWLFISILKGINLGITGGLEIVREYLEDILKS